MQDAGRAQRAAEQDQLSEAVEYLKKIDPLMKAVAAVPWLAKSVRARHASCCWGAAMGWGGCVTLLLVAAVMHSALRSSCRHPTDGPLSLLLYGTNGCGLQGEVEQVKAVQSRVMDTLEAGGECAWCHTVGNLLPQCCVAAGR